MPTKRGHLQPEPSSDHAARRALYLAWDAAVEFEEEDEDDLASRENDLCDGPLEPERLSLALDGRMLFSRGRQWQVRVYSVYDHNNVRWAQLGIESGGCLPITLRMSRDEGVNTIVRTLTSWLADPSAAGPVLDVL